MSETTTTTSGELSQNSGTAETTESLTVVPIVISCLYLLISVIALLAIGFKYRANKSDEVFFAKEEQRTTNLFVCFGLVAISVFLVYFVLDNNPSTSSVVLVLLMAIPLLIIGIVGTSSLLRKFEKQCKTRAQQ